MKLKRYLNIRSKGACRITKMRVPLYANEISILLNIDLPDKLFAKPVLEASITVPENAIKMKSISDETINNVQEMIKENIGIELNISVIPQED